MQFKNSLFYSRLDPILKVFCKESESNHSMFHDLRQRDRTIWKSEEISDEYFMLLKDVERSIATNITQSDQQNPIFLSIQSLADSIQTDDPITRLVTIWNSLEFAMSGLPSRSEFSKQEIKILQHQVDILLKKLNKNGILKLSDKQNKIIHSKLNRLNDAPIMERIKNYLIDNQIPFDSNEMVKISETRVKRNDVQHGRKNIIIKEEELEKLRSLTEKILLKRVCLSIR